MNNKKMNENKNLPQDPSKLTDKDKAQQLELGPMSGESKWKARVPEQIGIR